MNVKEIMEGNAEPRLKFVERETEYVKRPLHLEEEVHTRRQALRSVKDYMIDLVNGNNTSMTFNLAEQYNALFAHMDRLMEEEAELYGLHK